MQQSAILSIMTKALQLSLRRSQPRRCRAYVKRSPDDKLLGWDRLRSMHRWTTGENVSAAHLLELFKLVRHPKPRQL